MINSIEEVKSICEQLQATNSKKDKEKILLDNQNNQLFQNVLYFLLNPFIVTGLSEKKINKNVGKLSNVDYTELLTYDTEDEHYDSADIRALFIYVDKHNTGRDIDVSVCESFFTNYNVDMQEFIKSILTKSLKLGCDATTVNKIYGEGFIPVFDVMLGTPIDKCKIPEGTWFSISHKLNGSRCLYYKGDFYTRQGRKYTGLEHIKTDLQKVLINPNIVVDGELLRKNIDGKTDSQNFQVGIGIANSKADTKEELKLMIFDIMTVSDFEHGKSKLTYKDRKVEVEALREVINQLGFENISVVDMFYEGTDQTQIWKWLDYAEQNDLEGVMLNLDTPYECKRTKNLIKVKKFYNYDLKVIGYEEGTGRLKGTLGSLIVDYKGNPVSVGSGYDDKTRKEFWNNKDKLFGRVIEVKYKEITKDKKTGKESLQFPIFISLTPEGKEVSYN